MSAACVMKPSLWPAAWLMLSLATPAFGATTVEYLHTDALGSVVAVSNSAGTVIERREYEPYGRQLKPAVLEDGPAYTGHVSDAATGLSYMQQRYYDPGIGRFLSVDPVTANEATGGNFNRYWYAASNPYKFADPDGRIVRDPHERFESPRGRIDNPYGGCRMARACLNDEQSDNDQEEAEYVHSVKGQFQGKNFEYCGKICQGPNGYQLSDVRTDGSQIGCDAGPATCPSGTSEVSDIHNHPSAGEYKLNASDVRILGFGKVGQTFRVTPQGAVNFSDGDKEGNRGAAVNGWLVPASGSMIKFYNHVTGETKEYEIEE